MEKDNMEKVLGFSSELVVAPCKMQPHININTFLEQLQSDYMAEVLRLNEEVFKLNQELLVIKCTLKNLQQRPLEEQLVNSNT